MKCWAKHASLNEANIWRKKTQSKHASTTITKFGKHDKINSSGKMIYPPSSIWVTIMKIDFQSPCAGKHKFYLD